MTAKTASQLATARAAAAATYASAASALMTAWAQLAGLDEAASNSNVSGGAIPLATFGASPQIPAHPLALADVAALHRDPWGAAAAVRDAQLS